MPPSVCRPGLLLASLFLLIPAVPLLHAHGTMANPKSRVLRVYEDLTDGGPNHPATEAAIGHRGSDAYFTWNQVARFITPYDGAGASPYTRSIPDGQLASAANGTGLDFSGLDLVGDGWDWPAEEVSPGPIDLTWYATATHNPSSFKVFLTNTNYSHKTPLAWDQMEFLGEVTHTQSGSYYHFTVNLPERTGRHVLYVVWQRIDPAGEAFFAAVDLNFSGRGSGPSGLPVVGASDVTVEESAGVAAVSVTLSGSVAAGGTATVDYRTTPISATPDSDYTRTSGTLTFLPNQLEKTISVAIADDAVAEVREAFRVVLSNPKGLQLRTGTATISIADNDAGNSGGYSFEKRNDWGHGYDGWLHLSNPGPEVWDRPTLAFTLPPGADFSYFDSRFSGDIDTDGNVTVTGLGTLLPGETLSIDMVVNPAPGANDGPADLRIDGGALDAFPPDVSIADVERPEGDASGQSVTLFVQLDAAHPESVHVSYATVDDTATAGKDYTATSGSLEFIPGETRKTISVPFNGNAISEGDKVFLVVLGAVPGRPLPKLKEGGSQAIVRLIDDDARLHMTATGDTIVEGDSGTAELTFRLHLDRPVKPGETASIDYYIQEHGATAGADYIDGAGTIVFPPGSVSASVLIPVRGDTEDEVLEQFMLHFRRPVGIHPRSLGAVGQIIDNEFTSGSFGGQRIVAYVDGTGGAPIMPPADRVTHICLAFANLDANGDLIGGGSASPSMRQQNAAIRFLLSVGGWTWSANFPQVAADPVKRQTFAESCRAKIVSNDLDGIDLDWEWPGVPGGPGTISTSEDGHNYTLLVQALRAELDDLESETGRTYEISAFLPAGAGIGELELPALASLFDFINVQGYDLHGSWDQRTGHQAGLYHNPSDPQSDRLNIDTVLDTYLAGGFSREQLLVSAPFYCQRWTGVADVDHGLFQPGTGAGQLTYRDLEEKLQTIPRFWDDTAKVAYLFDAMNGEWISLDDPQAMYEKASYSLNGGFGGVFYWQQGGDTSDGHLLTTISDTLAFGLKADRDADGLLDDWEISHFGHLHHANGSSDADGDESSDLQEFQVGTDPRDASSFLGILNESLHSWGVAFTINAGTVPCEVEYSPTLQSGSWQVISSGHHSGSFSDTDPTRANGERGFYRLVVRRPSGPGGAQGG